jgi:salicylate hydroxylase
MNLLGNAQASQWQAEGWSIPATVKEFLGLFDDFPEPVRELIAAVPEPDLFKWCLRDREPLPVWTRGRVTMLGDAAHPMTPYLGQGACMAIEDGMILGRALAASQDLAEAFSRYEAARRDRANGVQLAAGWRRPSRRAVRTSCWPDATRRRPARSRPTSTARPPW